jgi:predicted helicase
VDKIFISSKTSTNAYVFPLYVNGNGLDGGKRRPNFSQKFLRVIGSAIARNTRGTVDVGDALETESVFQYIYGTLHSAKYRDRYGEFLKIDFPRIPLPVSRDVFHGMASLGGDLVALHLLENDYPHASWNQAGAKNKNPLAHPITTFHDAPGNHREVRKVGETGKKMAPSPEYGEGFGCVYINESAYFDGVPEEVWNFHIGGYQVCHKWLSDRKRRGGKNPRPGRVLTDEDIDHYQKIVVALSETIRIMAEIDEVIETHGGWPDAFITDPEEIAKLRGK